MPTPKTPTLSSATSSWSGSYQYGAPKITLALTINDNKPLADPPDDPPYPIIDGTEIERYSGGGWAVIFSCGGPLGGANHPTTYDDITTEDGTGYSYRVRVRDIDNNYSAYSDVQSAATPLPPPGPTNFEADPVTDDIEWEVPE